MRRRAVALAGALGALAVFAAPAQASVSVTTTTDEVASNSACSLREAITTVNTSAASFDGCTDTTPNPTTINVPASSTPYTLTRHGAVEDANGTGDLDVQHDMTIQGAGAASTVIDGDAADRVFDVFGAVNVTISGVTIQNGIAPTTSGANHDGGGVLSGAGSPSTNLALDSDVIKDNSAADSMTAGANGGGVAVESGTVNIADTVLSSNAAGSGVSTGAASGGAGGGIHLAAGTLSVLRSTIDGNRAGGGAPGGSIGGQGGPGGGIDVAGGTLTLTNSTVASNSAGNGGFGAMGQGGYAGYGGGIYMEGGSATLQSDTVAGNGAGFGGGGGPPGPNGNGGGVATGLGSASLAGTILSSNTPGGNCLGVADAGHNLSFNGSGCPAGFATGDPNLGPLQDNGGPTPTMTIPATSAAVDQVPAAGAGCPATDQRGIPRPQRSACDIGAFEVVNPTTLSVSKAGTGSGTVTSAPAGVNCGATCSAQFTQHSSVTLTAAPATGSTFGGWSGGGCSGTGQCTVTLNAGASVSATFTADPPPPRPPNTKISKAKINQHKHTASFKFKSIGGSKAKATPGFQCALLKRKHVKPKFKTCKSPKKYKHLKPRKYTFEVRAVDAAGKDATPAKKRFTIK